MALFIDTHDGTEMPSALREKITSRVNSGERDEHGVIDRGVLFDKQANTMHCVLEASDEDAVMKHHELMNVPLDHQTIHRADAILK